MVPTIVALGGEELGFQGATWVDLKKRIGKEKKKLD